MASIDPFASITGAVLDLLVRDGDMFLRLGTNLFRGLATIVIAWFGIRAALSSGEGRGGLPLGRFAALLMTIAFGYTMIIYYRTPIPGIGLSFTQLLTDQPIYLARQLEVAQVQRLSDRLAEVLPEAFRNRNTLLPVATSSRPESAPLALRLSA